METGRPPYLLMANSAIEHMLPAAHRMGVTITELSRGRVVGEVPMEGNGNHFGVMYAGVLFTVAEVLGGVIALPTFDVAEFYPLVTTVKINFCRPAKTTVTARTSLDEETIEKVSAEAAEKGKAYFELYADLHDESGALVATTHGLYQLRKNGT